MEVYIDLDDVLVDFVGAACRITGTDKGTLNRGQWEMTHLLKGGRNDFWKAVSATQGRFWESLQELPWFDDLLNAAADYLEDSNSHPDNWYILTSPQTCPYSYDGKIRWAKNTFGSMFDRIIVTPHKHLLARPGALLIDDSEANIACFLRDANGNDTGADALLFPSLGNSLHIHSADPMYYIKERLFGAF